MNWRAIDQFPKAVQGEWQIGLGRWTRKIVSQKAIEQSAAGWTPLSPLLVGTPESTYLLPPILVNSLQDKVLKSVRRRCQSSLAAILIFVAICLLLADVLTQPKMLVAAYILVGIEVFLMSEYWLVFRQSDALIERTLYSFWVRKTASVDIIFWAGIMLVAGSLQLFAQGIHGDLQPVIDRYGIAFQPLAAGEFWRLLSGPFLHNDFSHWATNSILLIFVGLIAGRISRPHAAAVFVAGSVVGVLVTWVQIPALSDGYLGVSAGVMGILGFAGGAAWRAKEDFPKALGITLISFGLLNIYLSWLSSADAANGAHIAGFALGIFWGLMFQQTQIRQNFRLEMESPF